MYTLRPFALLLLAFTSATAADSFADRLLAAPDEQSVEALLDAFPGAVTPDVFAACEASARARIDKFQYADALREFRTSLAVAQHLNSPASLGAAWFGIGQAQSRMGQLTASLATYEKGYPAAEQSADKPLLARYLRSRAIAYSLLGRFPEAFADAGRSLALYRELKDVRGAAMVLNNTCEAHRILGDLRLAAAECEEAWHSSQNIPGVAGLGLASLGPIAALQGNLGAARGYLEEAIRLQTEQNDKRYLAMSLLNIGPIYRQLNETGKAFATYERSLALARETGDVATQAMALFDRAAVYTNLKQYPEAIADLREGLRLREKDELPYQSAFGLSTISQLETFQGHTDDACRDANRALEIGRQFRSPVLLWMALNALGACEARRKNLPQARLAFEESVRHIESLRAIAGGGEQEGQRFLADKIVPYQHLLRILLDQGEPLAAFAIAERTRARQLLDAVRRGKTQPSGWMTPAEQQQEQRLNSELLGLDRRAAEAADPAAKSAARADWVRARDALESFRVILYANHPALAASRGEVAPITIVQTADLLPNARTLLVEFAVQWDSVYMFTVQRGPDGKPVLNTHRVDWQREALAGDVAAFRQQLATRGLDYRKTAATLYTRLLGPLAAELRGKDTLVLVPDNVLWNLPFQALLRPDGAHLIERQTVFYTPSLTYLRESRRTPETAAQRQILALGNPGSAGLPNATREAESLALLYGKSGYGTASALALTGGQATKQSWTSGAPDYRVLHLATHGVLNASNPMYSWLSLASARKGAPDDAIEAREILGLNLNADLAVLSACETASGEVLAGEGLVGMSWAFLAAGTRTTVVSQWKVDSAGTTQLMLGFHRNLMQSRDAGRARSLQKAVLDLMRTSDYRHPYYWAGFVMVGNGF